MADTTASTGSCLVEVAVVTDSTAALPPEVARQRGIQVVPMQVLVDSTSYFEAVPGGITAPQLAKAMRAGARVSTSRPNPAEILAVYEALAAAGTREVVSVHLSGELSGTLESAQQAARRASIPVRVVDSREVAMGTGFGALAAADAAQRGQPGAEVAAVAQARCESVQSFFYVDTLEYLRRGGRVGAMGAFVGSALAVKPILHVEDGKVVPLEKVRTASKALARMQELAVQSAEDDRVEVAISHLAAPERAHELAVGITQQLGDRLGGRPVWVVEVGAVLGAHVGPGMVGVQLSRTLSPS